MTRLCSPPSMTVLSGLAKLAVSSGTTSVLTVNSCSSINLVLEYIARYAYRVAITNSRILDVTDSEISYDYKQYKSGGKHGVMTMDIMSFLNLFSQHILPSRFVRIRHYGILSPCNRKVLRSIQQQLNVPPVPIVRKKKPYLEICTPYFVSFLTSFEVWTSTLLYRLARLYPRFFNHERSHAF